MNVNPRVLALDFDGTIAANGTIDVDVATSLAEARTAGLLVVLVTGRTLSDLVGSKTSFGDSELGGAIRALERGHVSNPREALVQAIASRDGRASDTERSGLSTATNGL